ncbi:MAG TPA: methyltransferase domain-containing protein [Verrucomicrobiae bacterium]|nr:methyltransferase domain-containing protein [Verrucomicrobiae bacterium]
MAQETIRFEDGAGYERQMGVWSRLAGEVFLDWLAPAAGLRWIDIGCGNGAFTELLVERCAPREVQGIDPSEAQLAFARSRPAARVAEFRQGSAMELPFPDRSFDAAVMALVIFFVPDPAKGVAEMARVVRPGGSIAAYGWDLLGGGFPLEPIRVEMQAMGVEVAWPPSPGASRIETLRELWRTAGIEQIEAREITVRRSFDGFEDFWTTSRLSSSMGPAIAAMAASDVEQLKARVRARLPAEAAGRLTCSARANAVKGRMPK